MTTQTNTVTPAQACIDLASVFQDRFLEDDATPHTAAERCTKSSLERTARAACLECPFVQRCLYSAVVQHDVSGFCGGTTERQRRQIRHLLDWQVQPENLDDAAGVTTANRQIDPHTVARLRAATPDESLENLALRLGCSLSTVKRHLRKVRSSAPATTLTQVPPSMEQVLHATGLVLRQERQYVSAA